MKKTIQTALKLPVHFDERALIDDLTHCFGQKWGNHYNTTDYNGSWTSIALYSVSGKEDDVMALPNSIFQETPLLSACPYFKQVLDGFKFQKESVRLLNLAPGSVVLTHRDSGLAYRFGCFRLHIPIITQANVEFVVAGEKLEMEVGSCWYADFDQPHSVNNQSDKQRIHLVIDGLRNEWTDKLFAEAGYDLNDKPEMDEETKKLLIKQLEHMDEPAAKNLLQELLNK